METLALLNFFVFLISVSIRVIFGLDLKKRQSWAICLFTGVFIGAAFVDIALGLKLGILFALAVLYTGAMNHTHRQFFK